MAERGKGLSDEALGTLVDKKLQDAVRWVDSNLSKEREKVLKYYNGELPARQKESSSSYISTDVYDGVESMKAQLLETFAAGREIVKFDPTGPEDAEPARIATAYCDHVVFSQNDGYRTFSDVIQDGLIARVGVAKVYWEEDFEDVEEEFEGLPEEAITLAAAEEAVQNLEAEQSSLDGTYAGKLTTRKDKSQVRIEVINPEEFGIESGAKDLCKEYFSVHKTVMHIDDLVKMGFSRKEIEEAGSEAKADPYDTSTAEQQARTQKIDGFWKEREDDEDYYQVNECYLKVRLKGDDYAKYYKVLRLGTMTLDKQEVMDHPFVAFVPLPIPHAFYGNSFAARIMPAQNIRTALTRAIVDHAAVTVNPRYTVLKGGLTNPRELLDNRLGGLVNVTRPDAVQPLEQAPLNPFVYQTLELIKAQNEETTGISSLSQGLNKDAVSKQNSDAMIERLVGLSQTRQKIIARNFANFFLIPLYLKVYDLVILKENKKKIVELAGNWVEINPSEWKERRAATVSLHLGYKEHENEAQKLIQVGGLMNQDPRLQRMFQDDNRYKLACDVMKLQGIGNHHDYITPPQKLPPEQPDPMAIAQMEIEKMKAEATLINAQASMKKVDLYGQIELSRKEDTNRQQQIDNIFREHEESRKDLDVANKVEIAQREMTLAENTPATDPKQTSIISPR
jgi:hypothetical protein